MNNMLFVINFAEQLFPYLQTLQKVWAGWLLKRGFISLRFLMLLSWKLYVN